MKELTQTDVYLASLGIEPRKVSPITSSPKMTPEQVAYQRQLINESVKKMNPQQKLEFALDILKKEFADVSVYMDDLGQTTLFTITDNVAKKITADTLADRAFPILGKSELTFTAKYMKEVIATWVMSAKKVSKLPASFSLDPSEVTFNRISLSLTQGECPTWDYFVKKCGSNGPALMAFIWSIFERNDESQQYLFLKGPGQDGKGSLIRWLDKLLNEQLQGLSAQDKYWPALCVGKRVGVFNDLNNTSIVMSSAFKQITGKDKISIEQKFEKAFAVTLDTKFILTTNHAINLTSSQADRRRAILVELEASDIQIEGYENKLAEETSAFLWKCKEQYLELYSPKQKSITCDYEFFDREASNFEEINEMILSRCFVLDQKSKVTAAEFQLALRQMHLDNNAVGNFKDWLARQHKVTRHKVREDGVRQYAYVGIKRK